MTRDYYQEALAILNGSSVMQPERKHLEALKLRNQHLENTIQSRWCSAFPRESDDYYWRIMLKKFNGEV